jgi:hypothetical protein
VINAAWTLMDAGFQSMSRTEVRIQQHRFVQLCIVELRIRNVGSAKPRIAQGCEAQICIPERGFSEFCASEICAHPNSFIASRLPQIRIPD